MQRIYVTFPLGIDVNIVDQNIHHQLTRVLRMRPGDHVILFDGDGSETEYSIQSIDKKSIILRGQDRTFPQTEAKKRVTLYQAMPNKYEKIEYILQKGVEVGIARFIFFSSHRSQKLTLSSAKIERFRTIAQEALEQCGGMVFPEIEFIDDVFSVGSPFFARRDEDMPRSIDVVLDTTGVISHVGQYVDVREVSLWVGPEGGWSEEERQKMSEKGFIFARFGERILRTETAGVVVGFALIHA